MSSWVRCLWVGLVLLTGPGTLLAASKAEQKAFDAAVRAYNDHFWERADRELGAFVKGFPVAEQRAEAVLLQAESRIKLKNFAGAIELLDAGRATAGRFGDEYLFWLAEARMQSGQVAAAAELFAKFTTDFVNSPRVLEAVVAEAAARAKLRQPARVTELLQRPEGVFQTRAKVNPTEPNVVRGRFLLAKTLFDVGQFKEAEAALLPLADANLDALLAWQRDHLLASLQLADNRAEAAFVTSSNLLTLATNQPALISDGLALRGRIFEKLGRADEAIGSWQQILLAQEASSERQREALLRVSELLMAQGRVAEALQTLEGFLATATNSPVADIAWLAVGDLRLRQFAEANGTVVTNTAAFGTNLLAGAQTAYESLLERFSVSPLRGKAQLGRGWCLWLAGRPAESAGAFASAAETLSPSYDQAVARFKLGDAQLLAKDYAGALSNYQAVIAGGNTLAAGRSNLVEQALYQVLHVAREAGNDAAAGAAMARLLEEFPESPFAESGLLAFGSSKGNAVDPAMRRAVLEDYLQRDPDSKLAPGVRLAVARTFEQERNWSKAAEEYSAWLTVFPDHSSRARAEYFRALALSRSGDETNAFVHMTNYVAIFPTNEFAALAQWWVADHFWREEDFRNAELNYQLLFNNHPESERRFEAQLMAGRSAWARQRPDEAAAYFQSLTGNTNCPPGIEAQAYFANGDMLMESKAGETNAAANFVEAIKSYRKVQYLYPDTEIAVLAEGKIGECYKELGAYDSAQYENARRSFDKLLLPPVKNVAARSQAEVGLGLVLEKQSLPGATNQNVVLQQALERYLHVVYGKNLVGDEPADPYWVKRAGLEACRIAESLQQWEQLAKLCDTLSANLPALRPLFDKKKARAEENLKKSAN